MLKNPTNPPPSGTGSRDEVASRLLSGRNEARASWVAAEVQSTAPVYRKTKPSLACKKGTSNIYGSTSMALYFIYYCKDLLISL